MASKSPYFTVDKILGWRLQDRRFLEIPASSNNPFKWEITFKVRWQGYDESWDTYEPLSGFQDPQFVMKQVEELLAAGYDGVHPNTLQVEADEQQAAYEARVKVKKEQDRMAKATSGLAKTRGRPRKNVVPPTSESDVVEKPTKKRNKLSPPPPPVASSSNSYGRPTRNSNTGPLFSVADYMSDQYAGSSKPPATLSTLMYEPNGVNGSDWGEQEQEQKEEEGDGSAKSNAERVLSLPKRKRKRKAMIKDSSGEGAALITLPSTSTNMGPIAPLVFDADDDFADFDDDFPSQPTISEDHLLPPPNLPIPQIEFAPSFNPKRLDAYDEFADSSPVLAAQSLPSPPVSEATPLIEQSASFTAPPPMLPLPCFGLPDGLVDFAFSHPAPLAPPLIPSPSSVLPLLLIDTDSAGVDGKVIDTPVVSSMVLCEAEGFADADAEEEEGEGDNK